MENEIIINGVTYTIKETHAKSEKYPIKMVRTFSAGVFYGELKERNGKECVLLNARRIYYWEGASTLSQLAQSGTSLPNKCTFPESVDIIELTEVIEILSITEKALETLNKVKIWKS